MGAGASSRRQAPNPPPEPEAAPTRIPTYQLADDDFNDHLELDQGCRCPITHEIMRDPVICADGHSYERAAIDAWLQMNSISPLTGLMLPHKSIVPNHALRGIIDERRRRRRDAPQLPSTPSNEGLSTWRIDPTRLKLTDTVLGRGSWGVVRLGYLQEGAGSTQLTAVAVKLMPEAPASVTESLETELETIAFATIRCSHVCRLLGSCAVEDTVALVMKLCARPIGPDRTPAARLTSALTWPGLLFTATQTSARCTTCSRARRIASCRSRQRCA